jgi:spore coat protein U-like protein
MMKAIRLCLAGALLAVGIPLTAQAQTPVVVQVQVNGTCALSAPVDATFGAQSPTGVTNLTTTGSVTLTCNRGALPVVSVGNGNNFSGTRRMAGGTPTGYVGYNVKQPTISGTNNYTVCPAFNAGADWGSTAPTDTLSASAAFTGSGGPRTVNLCFQTTVDQDTAVATYTDTVQVSVTF